MKINSELLERILLDNLHDGIEYIYEIGKHTKIYNANSDIVSVLVDYAAEHSLNFIVPFASIFFADNENSIIAVSREGVIKNNFTIVHSDYLSQTRSSPGVVKIGRPILDFNSGKQAIPIAIGIERSDRKYLGTLVAMIDLLALKKAVFGNLKKTSLTEYDFAVFVNKTNLVFGTSGYGKAKFEKYGNADNLTISAQDRVVGCDSYQMISKFSFFDSNSRHEVCSKISGYNLIILSMYSHEAMLRVLGHLILPKLIIMLSTLAVSIILCALMMYNVITQGLKSCTLKLASLCNHDKIEEPKKNSILEVCKLIENASIVDNFIQSLKYKIKTLTLHNRDLEVSKEYMCFIVKKERSARYEDILELNKALVLSRLEKDRREFVEQKLSQSESINSTNSIFVSNISHELRTPLNAIIGFAEIMSCMKSFEGKPKEYIKDIYRAARHISEIIEDVLDSSSIISGKAALCEVEVDLKNLLDYCLRCLSNLYSLRNISITVDMSISKLLVDEKRFKQIILNLLSNALKFTSSSVDVYTMLVDNNVLIVIEDDGVGISEADTIKVLGVFARAESRLRREGLGLGLPLVKRLVELHQGELSIISTPDKGTKVTIALSIDRVR